MYALLPQNMSDDNHLIECIIAARGVRQGASKKSTSRKTSQCCHIAAAHMVEVRD